MLHSQIRPLCYMEKSQTCMLRCWHCGNIVFVSVGNMCKFLRHMLALIYRDKSNDYYVVHRHLVYLSVETLAYAGAWRYIIWGDLKEKKSFSQASFECFVCASHLKPQLDTHPTSLTSSDWCWIKCEECADGCSQHFTRRFAVHKLYCLDIQSGRR